MSDSDRVRQLETRIAELERAVEVSDVRTRRPMRMLRRLAVVALAVAVALPGGVALASHQFTDVPDSNLFHAEIDALVGAGITNGCGGGMYCPGASVTRGQMAGFLSRSLGRAAADSRTITFAELVDSTPIAEVTMSSGGVPGATGYVVVTAYAEIMAIDGVCPCDVQVAVRHGASEYSPVSTAVVRTKIGSGWWLGSTTVSWVFEVTSGESHTFSLVPSSISYQGGESGSFASGRLTAVYVPFGPETGSASAVTGSSVDSAPALVGQ